VAYRAKPALAEVADARLDHHGLDALLWAQGIRRREWVTAKATSANPEAPGAARH
jgi:phosphoserine phosphatase